MPDSSSLNILTGKLIIGLLLFIRIMGFVSASPFFRSMSIPGPVKIFLGVILAFSVTSAFWTEQPVIEFHLWYMVLLVMKEFFLGVAIGFVANAVFWGARTAGGLIDYDLGFFTAMLFNMDEDTPTIVGELKEMIVIMLFLFLNGHHFLIEGIYASVRAVPITTFAVTESTITMLIKMATTVFLVGLKMAAPVIAAIFLTNLALALLARVAPQTNIFILSFQLKIAVGLLVLFASSALIVMVAKYSLQGFENEIMKFIMTLNPARV
ncbi:MAG: flagellar biosynthetic protein FliR [Ignavibacteriae bacterium]|nr:flagellar biosynthetic protein FliR [Ignavibacteriota bacterium]